VCAQLHFNICKEIGVELGKEHWQKDAPTLVERSHDSKVTILWNKQVKTDRTIPFNKPEILIRGNGKGTCLLIDLAISENRNVIKKEADKILKYKNLPI
jgi:hypothetical protein